MYIYKSRNLDDPFSSECWSRLPSCSSFIYICLSTYIYIYKSISPFYIYFYLSFSLSKYIFIYLYGLVSFYLSLYLSINISIYLDDLVSSEHATPESSPELTKRSWFGSLMSTDKVKNQRNQTILGLTIII